MPIAGLAVVVAAQIGWADQSQAGAQLGPAFSSQRAATVEEPAPAEEAFDFGDLTGLVDDGPEHRGSALGPGSLTGALRLVAGRQIGGDSRWNELGPSLELTYDWFAGWGQLRLEGACDLNLAYQVEHDPRDVRLGSEIEPRLRELLIRRAIGDVTISAGSIVTAWSVGDMVTLADKVSVTDQSRAFFDDPENVISGQAGVRVDLYSARYSLSAVLVPYPLFDRFEDGDHPYSITPGIELDAWPEGRTPELAMRISTELERGSVSALAGWVSNRSPILEARKRAAGEPRIFTRHEPYAFIGAVGTFAYDPALLKIELIYDSRRPRQLLENGLPTGFKRADQLGLLLGLDLNAGKAGMLMLEVAGEALIRKDERFARNRDTWRAAMGWSDEYLNDTLKLRATTIFLESTRNVVARLDASYAITDSLTVSSRLSTFIIKKHRDSYANLESYDRADLVIEIGF